MRKIELIENLVLFFNYITQLKKQAIWAFENGLTTYTYNGRNSIGNCLCGLSNSSYGFKWEFIKELELDNEIWKQIY